MLSPLCHRHLLVAVLAVAFLSLAVGMNNKVIVELMMETAIVAVIAKILVTVVQMLPALEVSSYSPSCQNYYIPRSILL